MTEQIAARRPGVRVQLQRLFVRIGVLPFLLVIALIVFSSLSPRFLTSENLITVARQATYLAIVSMGQMLALLTGGFDLSVGKIIAITSVITAMTMAQLAAAHPDDPAAVAPQQISASIQLADDETRLGDPDAAAASYLSAVALAHRAANANLESLALVHLADLQ